MVLLMKAVSQTPTHGEPLASVAMITYNHAPFICEAVEGVLKQNADFPFELVIGEDCSTDGTRETVLNYAKRFPNLVRLVTSDKNVGAQINLDRVMNACRGRFMATCEGDDFWHNPNKLRTQVEFLQENPAYSMTHSDVQINFVCTGKRVPGSGAVRGPLYDDQAYLEILSGARRAYTPTLCLRTQQVKKVIKLPEFHDPRFLMGDTQLCLEIARLGRVRHMPTVLATRNDLPESASRSRDVARMLRFVLSAQAMHLHYVQKYPCPSELARLVRITHARAALYYAYQAVDHAQAVSQWSELRSLQAAEGFETRAFLWGSRNSRQKFLVRLLLKLHQIIRHVPS